MDWRTALKSRSLLVSDGAWGTELARRGLSGDVPELWNESHPDVVGQIAAAYVEAGSDVILTNTFGGSPLKLGLSGLQGRAAALNRLGVALSRKAAGDRALVFASIGPTGEFIAPLGARSRREFVAGFTEQVRGMIEGGPDGFVIETMSDLGEAEAALEAVRNLSDLPVVVSFAFGRGPRGFATMMGVTPEQAASRFDELGADIVGSNCGQGVAGMVEITEAMRSATGKPLWIKPNAGLPELVGGQTVYRETADQMAESVPRLVEAGANVIGGCCGTTPEHVRRLVEVCRAQRELARRASVSVLSAL